MNLVKRFTAHAFEALKIFNEDGFKIGIKNFWVIIKRIFYEQSEYEILAYSLSTPISLPSLPNQLVIHRVRTKEEIIKFGRLEGFSRFIPGNIAWLRKVFDEDGIGFMVFDANQVVACGWISLIMNPNLMQISPPLSAGDAYFHTLFVSPAYRGKKIAMALVAQRLQYLQQHNYKRALTAINVNNLSVRTVYKNTGFHQLKKIKYSRFLFWAKLDGF